MYPAKLPGRAIASFQKDESGAAMVEFAISLAVLAPLFIGTIDLGLAMYRWLQVNDTAEAGALYATNMAQSLYSGPVGGGAFDEKGSITAAAGGSVTNDANFKNNATTTVIGVCSCPPTIPTSCPATTQFAPTNGTGNAPTPYCTAACNPSESAYVCIKSSFTYTPLIAVPYLPPITLSATSMVKIH
jgi:Flp pilus assembly pilin Flp